MRANPLASTEAAAAVRPARLWWLVLLVSSLVGWGLVIFAAGLLVSILP